MPKEMSRSLMGIRVGQAERRRVRSSMPANMQPAERMTKEPRGPQRGRRGARGESRS